MRRDRGFTLLEAAIAASVLMVGAIALIQVGDALVRQVRDIRSTQGHPPVAERLLHDQMVLIRSSPVAGSYAAVSPLAIGNATYSIQVFPPVAHPTLSTVQIVEFRALLNGASMPNTATVRILKDSNL